MFPGELEREEPEKGQWRHDKFILKGPNLVSLILIICPSFFFLFFFVPWLENLKGSSGTAVCSPALGTGLSPCSLWSSELVWLCSDWACTHPMASVSSFVFQFPFHHCLSNRLFFFFFFFLSGENILSPAPSLYLLP